MSDAKYSLMANEQVQDASVPQFSPGQPAPPGYSAPPQQYGQVHQQPGHMPGYSTLPQQGPGAPVMTNQPTSTFLVNTTIVTTQPTGMPRPWRQNLCDCCKNCNVCVSVYLCRLAYSCAVAKKLGENECIVCCPGGLGMLRAKIRSTHNIQGTLMDDVCKSIWCEPCVLCQMGVELNAEGYPTACGCF